MKKEYTAPELNVLSFTANAPVASAWNPEGWWGVTTSTEFTDPWDEGTEE